MVEHETFNLGAVGSSPHRVIMAVEAFRPLPVNTAGAASVRASRKGNCGPTHPVPFFQKHTVSRGIGATMGTRSGPPGFARLSAIGTFCLVGWHIGLVDSAPTRVGVFLSDVYARGTDVGLRTWFSAPARASLRHGGFSVPSQSARASPAPRFPLICPLALPVFSSECSST